LQEVIPLDIKECPSGKNVYDWTIPKEWNIRDGWVKNSGGTKIVDFKKSNLHVVSYSTPVSKRIRFGELKKHLHYLEELPDAVPYRTSYYKEDWGFCISYNDYKEHFKQGEEYEVFIDSELKEGSLTIGELLVKGRSRKEHLLSTYICHPSLANDNLSGVVLTAFLARELLKKDLNFSYRIIFVPETIGAITYCAMHEEIMKNIGCGFVITTVGGPGKFGYKQSFDKDHYINQAIEEVFREKEIDFIRYPFNPLGSDERQYSSPGFRINVATICKDKYQEYNQYHTFFDNLDFVKPEHVNQTLELYLKAIEKIDKDRIFKNRNPNCEPMLSKYNLYPPIGGRHVFREKRPMSELEIILWLLFYCDGKTGLLDISRRLDVPVEKLYEVAKKMEGKGILEGFRYE
jgi:aminopeptidase-like protein